MASKNHRKKALLLELASFTAWVVCVMIYSRKTIYRPILLRGGALGKTNQGHPELSLSCFTGPQSHHCAVCGARSEEVVVGGVVVGGWRRWSCRGFSRRSCCCSLQLVASCGGFTFGLRQV